MQAKLGDFLANYLNCFYEKQVLPQGDIFI
jgi:hypothetical protein